MSFLYLFLYVIVGILTVCSVVSIIQFFIDLRRCSALRSELKELINRAKLLDVPDPSQALKEVEDNADTN